MSKAVNDIYTLDYHKEKLSSTDSLTSFFNLLLIVLLHFQRHKAGLLLVRYRILKQAA